jgi:hypothetical protein
MFKRRLLVASAIVLMGVAGGIPLASPAWAAPPSNDDSTTATVIDANTTFPITENTTEATTSAEETAINSSCGAPRLEQGVWFVTTATQSGDFVVDVTQSDYSAGIAALTGSPGNFTFLACGPGTISGPVVAGTTYYLLVFGDGGLSGNEPTSGNLVFDIHPAAPAPTVALTVDSRGTVDKQGVAHISGTVTCTSEDGSGSVLGVIGSMQQRVGRFFINGSFSSFGGASCDGTTTPWAADVPGDNGRFSGGKAATVSMTLACTSSCTGASAEATIQLSHQQSK